MSDVPEGARRETGVRIVIEVPPGFDPEAHARRLDHWFGAYCEAKALGGSAPGGLARLMALADVEVAAERQRLHDLDARVEALADAIQVEQIITTMDASSDDRAYVRGFNSGLHKATWIVNQALVSPVSDDTGGTKP